MICAKEGKGVLGLLRYMPERIYLSLGKIPVKTLITIEEIRMSANNPLMVFGGGMCFYVSDCGELSSDYISGMIITSSEVEETLRLFCDGSVYAMEENIKNGYVTLYGGHRVGICGTAVSENNRLLGIKDISCLNIRVARELKGIAQNVISSIITGGLKNTLIISPPGGGKTTLLRDICRILGGDIRFHYKVAVADERGEIAGAYKGSASNNIGVRTCFMDGCPKHIAMEMLLRSMGPDIIITDEIGGYDDECAIKKIITCGVCVIATAHGSKKDDLNRFPFIGKGGFENIIFLNNKQVEEILYVG